MSLLLKALKKAEQKPVQETTTPLPDLSLEPLQRDTRYSPGAATYSSASAGSAAQAASILSLGQGMRFSLVPTVAGLAALFLIGWGIYVYLQVRQPSSVTVSSMPSTPSAQARVPDFAAPPVSIPISSPPPAVETPIEVAVVPTNKKLGFELREPSLREPTPRIANARAALRADKEKILVTQTASSTTLSPLLTNAYTALQQNRFDEAQAQYQKLLQSEPSNMDALLGMAAIATHHGKVDLAAQYYAQILELDPKNAIAQAGLINLSGQSDALAAESRLKQLLANGPSALVYFALGNLYVEQNRWADAEQAYFEAQQIQPTNPDYAFNLAVSLERINQPKLALTYYLRAQQLMHTKGGANFDPVRLSARIAQLKQSVE